jgi:hypothetical protein
VTIPFIIDGSDAANAYYADGASCAVGTNGDLSCGQFFSRVRVEIRHQLFRIEQHNDALPSGPFYFDWQSRLLAD